MTDPLDLARRLRTHNLPFLTAAAELIEGQHAELNHYRHLANGRGIAIDQLESDAEVAVVEATRLREAEKVIHEVQVAFKEGAQLDGWADVEDALTAFLALGAALDVPA